MHSYECNQCDDDNRRGLPRLKPTVKAERLPYGINGDVFDNQGGPQEKWSVPCKYLTPAVKSETRITMEYCCHTCAVLIEQF